MTLIDEVVGFIAQKDALELLRYFWYFILFDFTRYLLLDLALISYFITRHGRRGRERVVARQRLFAQRPLVTVMAPGKNEGAHIPALVESLARQTYRHVELIVVDDGSTDDTPAICRDLLAQGRIQGFFRNGVRGGKASAANLALRYSKGEYVIHLDADTHLAEDAVEKILLPFFISERVGAVAGDVRVANLKTSLASGLQAIEYMKGISVGRTVHSMLGTLRIVSGAFGAFRRDLLVRLGGWDVGPGLDGDLTMKIRKLHLDVAFEPEAICYTNVPVSFARLARQRYRRDRSLIRFRTRRHVDFLVPDRNFRLRNFVSSFENIFFNVVLDLKWWIYIVQIGLFMTAHLKLILLVNFLLYLTSASIQFLLSLALYGHTARRQEIALVWLLPLVPIYTGYFLRIVRTYAYLMEWLFKASYLDAWNPWKTSRVAHEENL
ncbi:MAG: glycosyltransferase [Pseudomonadota bacterium]